MRLADHHHTGAFSSGTPLLDDFLRDQAYLEDEGYGTTWVVVPDPDSQEVIAFYTLLYPYEAGDKDGDVLRASAVELLCLAVDTRHQNRGVGTKILRGLTDRILDSQDEYPIDLLLLVAISPSVREWYLSRGLGFRTAPSPQDRMTQYLPLSEMGRVRDADPQWHERRHTLPEFFWSVARVNDADRTNAQ